MYTVSITSQGQITIPSEIRKKLNLIKKGKANIFTEGGRMIMEPVKDLLELSGTLKTSKKPLSSNQIHKLFSEYMASRKRRPKISK